MSQRTVPDGPSSYVLDASAVLALLHREPGLEVVQASIAVSFISSVNWAEVIQKIIAHGGREPQDIVGELLYVGLTVVPFSRDDAEMTAGLWSMGRSIGLSLADRACLSLAQRLGLPALTGDCRWATLDLNAEVRLIR
ncbi:MAG TPA: PIN domain-containing protein [Dehalococcoidia bacterium]|nr:PIN domain-containing protein [Dehalococcoidia bacterium]